MKNRQEAFGMKEGSSKEKLLYCVPSNRVALYQTSSFIFMERNRKTTIVKTFRLFVRTFPALPFGGFLRADNGQSVLKKFPTFHIIR